MSASRRHVLSLEPRRLLAAPVAAVDFYNVNEDQSLVVDTAQGVLANDFDPDSDPLIAIVTNLPQHGTVAMNPNGGFTYTPEADYFGNDGFSYIASDTLGPPSAITGVGITIDPVPDHGKLAFSASDFQTTEQAGTGMLTVVRTGGSDGIVSVDYAITPETATEFDDYFPFNGVLTFFPGEVSQDIFIGINADTEPELSETLKVTLSNPTGGATFAGGTPPEATLTIVNSDPPPQIFFNDPAPVIEGNTGTTTNIPFELTLSEISNDPVTVDFFFGFGSATAGEDFDDSAAPNFGTGSVTFAPGETSKTIFVPVIGDTVNELDESLSIGLFGATNAMLADSIAFGAIVNDDNINPTANPGNLTREPGPGSVQIFLSSLVTSPDGDALSLTIENQPDNGTLTINDNATPADASDDVLTYTPGGLGTLDDLFSYEVSDPFGGSALAEISIETRGSGLIPNPTDPTKTDLLIATDDQGDAIRLQRTRTRGEVRVTWNDAEEGVFAPTGRIIITGGDGDDVIDARGLIMAVEIFAGAGNDLVRGGRGADMIYGEDGDDHLRGGDHRDVLVGGEGPDRLVGGNHDDILISGTTLYDDDSNESQQFRADLLAAWTVTGDRDQRIAAIAGGTTESGVFLDSSNVVDDDAEDFLSGSDGVDWFFAISDEANGVKDRFNGEFGTDEFTELA